MIGFFAGLFVGGFFGVVTMCILSVAGQSDCDFDDSIIQYDGSDVNDKTETEKE